MKYLVFPGSFKPPHVGHFKIIEKYVKDKTIDKIFIFISQKPRLIYPPFNKKTYQLSSNELKNTCNDFLNKKNCDDSNKEIVKKIDKAVKNNKIPGITLEQSYTIWNYYLDLLTDKQREKVKLFKSRLPSPVLFSFVVVKNMVKKGDAWAVATSDFDTLLFGAPRMIKNLTLSQQRRLPGGRIVYTFLEYIELKKVLKELGLTQDQLIHLGILVGTDFNVGGIKGIGPKKALKLLRENKDMNKVYKDFKVNFEWEEIYKIFHQLNVKKDYKLEFKGINHQKIHELLVEEHDFSETRVDNILEKVSKKPKNQKGLSEFF